MPETCSGVHPYYSILGHRKPSDPSEGIRFGVPDAVLGLGSEMHFLHAVGHNWAIIKALNRALVKD